MPGHSSQWVKKHIHCHKDAYSHLPLDTEKNSIRLIELLPGSFDEELRCRLSRATISHKRPYKALSYAWGSDRKCCCLDVDGACLSITQNLFDALLQLRSTIESQWFWVDAICIDQKSIAERNHQVSLMNSIYSEATVVVVWLGLTEKKWMCKIWGFNFLRGMVKGRHLTSIDPLWQDLLHSEWFGRAWVLQEVVYADNIIVFFGKSRIKWKYLVGLANYIQKYPHPLKHDPRCLSAARKISYMDKWRRLDPSRLRIEDVVYVARTSGCQKPVDRIYSVLSLVPRKDGRLLFEPDYGLNNTQVQTEFTKAVIRESLDLNILRYVDHSPHEIILPSWIPRWREDQPHPLPVECDPLSNKHPHFEVCRFLAVNVASPIDGNPRSMAALSVMGCFVSRTACTGSIVNNELNSQSEVIDQHTVISDEFVEDEHEWESKRIRDRRFRTSVPIDPWDRGEFRKFLDSRRRGHGSENQGYDCADSISSDVLNDNLISLGVSPKAYTHATREKVSFPVLRDVRNARYQQVCSLEKKLSSISSDGVAIPTLASGRRIALTEAEIYALVPAASRPGDLIAAFYGIRLLFVVRPLFTALDGSQFYVLIGPCELEEEIIWADFEEEPAQLHKILFC